MVLSRARLNATILLPVGSEPGEYEVQLVDANLQSRVVQGDGGHRGLRSPLETSLDTRALPPGSYQLALRRQGEDWRLLPAQLQ